MRLGFVVIGQSLEQETRFAREAGFDCVELIVHPGEPGEKLFEPDAAKRYREVLCETGVRVASVIHSVNPLSQEAADAEAARRHVERMIELAPELGARLVCGTTGQNPSVSVDESVRLYGKLYRELVRKAEGHGVRIAFENCLHGYPQGANLAVSPELWEKLFNELDSPAVGLEFDPSHLVFQGIDPVRAARAFASRIFQVHAKDTEIMPERLEWVGVYGLESWWRFRLPGYGQVDWPRLFQVFREGGFDEDVIIEHEDPVFEQDRFHEGLIIGKRFLDQFVW